LFRGSAPGSPFVAEPELLLYDELREPRVYQAILQAIGAGAHTLDDISNTALIGKTHLSAYLGRLQELHLVERRLPATVPPAKRRISRLGRYHIVDPFLHFYFSFIAPRRDEVGYRPEPVLVAIQEQLRSFVGQTAFEALARAWVDWAGQTGRLSFEAEHVAGTGRAEGLISQCYRCPLGWPARPFPVAAAYPDEALQTAAGHPIPH
jgi:AAA+ ATPase superfamily predicted ATPase